MFFFKKISNDLQRIKIVNLIKMNRVGILLCAIALIVFALSGCGGGGGSADNKTGKSIILKDSNVSLKPGESTTIIITESGYKSAEKCHPLTATPNEKKAGLGATVPTAVSSDGISVAIAIDKKNADSAGSCSYKVTVTAKDAKAQNTSFTISDTKDTSVKASLVVTVGGLSGKKITINNGKKLSAFTGTINTVNIIESGYAAGNKSCNKLSASKGDVKDSAVAVSVVDISDGVFDSKSNQCSYTAKIKIDGVKDPLTKPQNSTISIGDKDEPTVGVATLSLSINTSKIGTVWKSGTGIKLQKKENINAIAYGNGVFVISSGSSDSQNNYIYYSDNGGKSFQPAKVKTISSIMTTCSDVIYGNGKFLAACSEYIFNSTDGKNWEIAPSNKKGIDYNKVASGLGANEQGASMAIVKDGDDSEYITWKNDADNNWTDYKVLSTIATYFLAIGYSNKKFYILGIDENDKPVQISASISTKNINYKHTSNNFSAGWQDIECSNQFCVAVAQQGDQSIIYKNEKDIWSTSKEGDNTSVCLWLYSVAYAEGLFVTGSGQSDGTTPCKTNRVLISTDMGKSFKSYSVDSSIIPNDNLGWYFAYGAGTIVVVDSQGYVMTSGTFVKPEASK